jgi:cellulose synthase operon protein C
MSVARSISAPKRALRFGFPLLIALALAGCSSAEERAKSYYDHGMKLMADHDNAKAAIEFKNAVKAKKDFLPAWVALANIEELNHNFAGMVPILQTIVELDPKDVGDRVKLARLLVRTKGGAEEALKLINTATEIDNHNADALALKAGILFKLGDPNGATQAAQAALKIDPQNPGAISAVAAERLTRGDSKGALELLNKATAQEPNLGLDLFKLKIFEQTKDLQQAEALLRKLAELHPTELEFRKQLVQLYVFQHRLDDAVKEQRAIVAAAPNDQGAELVLVNLLIANKGAATARQELISRIDAGGDIFPFQIALAEFDFSQGNIDSGVQLLKTLISKETSSDHVLAAQVKLAEFYLGKKQVPDAEAVVSEILAKDARNTNGLRLRAVIRMDRGEVESAINDLRQALNDQPRSAGLMLLLATAYERSGSIELAEKQFADAMRTSNFDPNIGLNYVAFLERRGSTDRADDVLKELTSRWPQNPQILARFAQVKLQRQDWAAAQEIADTIKRLGNNAVADQVRAAALAGQNKVHESIEVLQNAYEASPTAAQPMAALVDAYVRDKQPEKAVALLQAALKTNPNNAEAYALLGVVNLASKQPSEALKNLTTAISKDPKNIVAYRALAELYLGQRNVDKAQEVIRNGLTQQPDNATLHLMLANTLELKGDYEAAIAEYQAMLDKDPGSLIAANNLASLLADHRTDKTSLERAQSLATMLRKSPIPQFRDTLGWASYQNGDYRTAVSELEEASAAMPSRAVVHYHLGMAYLATSQLAKAGEQLKTALNQAPDVELKAKIEAALKKTAS